MKLACIAFTAEGMGIAEKLKQRRIEETDIFNKHSYKGRLGEIFESYEGIVFVSSTGIAVRLCAPYLIHKTKDPAIVVIDDLGRYCISLVSGHLGGANKLTYELSEVLQCQAVVTTATEGRDIEAVDMFAKRNGLFIESMEDAKRITAMMLEGKKLKLETEQDLELRYPNICQEDYDGVIFVTSCAEIVCPLPHVVLRPKNINVGVGCRKGKSKAEIIKAIETVFHHHNLSLKSIKSIATVDVKKDEDGILEACEELGCSLIICSREEIGRVQEQFAASEFVKSSIGVSSVCEPCAYLAGGKIIVSKTAMEGITIAAAKER